VCMIKRGIEIEEATQTKEQPQQTWGIDEAWLGLWALKWVDGLGDGCIACSTGSMFSHASSEAWVSLVFHDETPVRPCLAKFKPP